MLLLAAAAAPAQTESKAPPARGTLPEPGDDLSAFFAAMDANGDHAISRAEFTGWFGSTPVTASGGGDGITAYFDMMDANQDGQISQDEFVRFNRAVDRSGD